MLSCACHSKHDLRLSCLYRPDMHLFSWLPHPCLCHIHAGKHCVQHMQRGASVGRMQQTDRARRAQQQHGRCSSCSNSTTCSISWTSCSYNSPLPPAVTQKSPVTCHHPAATSVLARNQPLQQQLSSQAFTSSRCSAQWLTRLLRPAAITARHWIAINRIQAVGMGCSVAARQQGMVVVSTGTATSLQILWSPTHWSRLKLSSMQR